MNPEMTATATAMQIERSVLQDAVVIRIEGRFEFGTRHDYKRLIGQIVQEGHRRLVLDLEGVTFVDSSALGLLLLTDQNFKLKKGHFSLVKPTGYVRQVIELANLPRVIPVYDSIGEAIAGHAEPIALRTPISSSVAIQ
ncbi:MAG: STAS domain-containing protein [Nitrospirae bacterium]|nr:MAG: STAS domain-containing protein [Nitrospirota bacterium]